uniref:WAP domain-containing protein n=1 Tax=Cyanistes caeruleus TaxID=156563 RepID=A0A8C0U6Z8_CYACU
MKTVAALLLVGMLILWAELPTGRRYPGMRYGAWSCPPVRFTCALHNPRNQCLLDRHCPRGKKCCQSVQPEGPAGLCAGTKPGTATTPCRDRASPSLMPPAQC